MMLLTIFNTRNSRSNRTIIDAANIATSVGNNIVITNIFTTTATTLKD